MIFLPTILLLSGAQAEAEPAPYYGRLGYSYGGGPYPGLGYRHYQSPYVYPPSYNLHLPSLHRAPVTYNYNYPTAPLAPVAPTLPSVAAPAIGPAVGPAVGSTGPAVSHSVAAVPDVSHLEPASGVTASQYHAQDELGNYSFGYNNPNSARVETGNPQTGVRGSVSLAVYQLQSPHCNPLYTCRSYTDGFSTYHYVADDQGFRHV